MKELSFEKMLLIEGGDWVDWVDSACAITGILSWKNLILSTGLGVTFCTGYAVGRVLGSL